MQDTITFKIPFYDIDPMQVVWHGNYIKYMECGRCAFLEKRQMTYAHMSQLGVAFPVVSLKIKYIRSCVFGQEVSLTTTLEPCDNCLIFKYVLRDAKTGDKLMQAQTRQMAVEMTTKQSLFELPKACLDRLKE